MEDRASGIPSADPLYRGGRANIGDRVAALIEVVAAFALVHLTYRSFKHFTELGRLEGAAGLNFSPGCVMVLFTFALLLLCRRSFAEYGLTLRGWPFHLNIGLFWGLLVVVVAGLIIKLAAIDFDPRQPPGPKRAVVFAVGWILATLLLARFLMRDRSLLGRVPPLASLVVLIALLSLPLFVGWYSHRPVLQVLLTVLWLFFGAGFGEEIFFRGYIQSRVNHTFGRPWRFLGIDFGWGLMVSSLLFGFIHALNRVDYFAGRFDFAWWWMVANFAAGLFHGLLREKTRSILPGAIIHGLSDVLAQAPTLFDG
jgi:membrane protease YdiL (CAAX protease family)